jgi:putative oxidoreductase
MNVASTIARILLGMLFLAAGFSGFILANAPPPVPPGLAADFERVFFQSHWVLFVDAVEMACGVLLLANSFVPLSLTALAGVIFNIAVYHLTIMPAGLPAVPVVLTLWVLAALPHRETLMRLVHDSPTHQTTFANPR